MVGQLENSFMPWRTEESVSTSTPLNLTPRWLRICTTAAEKPHCGKTGVPFMKSTTGLLVTSCLIRSNTMLFVICLGSFAANRAPWRASVLGRARLQGEGVQLVAHAAAQGLVDHLMLLDARLALEGGGDDMRRVMVAVAPEILDRHPRIGEAVADQLLDRRRIHCHRNRLSAGGGFSAPSCRRAATLR